MESAASGASGGPGGGGVKDDITSPVSAFLSHNITPRSGSRQTRVDSASSTPTGTPNPERNSDWDTRSAFASAFDGDMSRKHVVTFSPPSVGGSRNDASDSKFLTATLSPQPASRPQMASPPTLAAQAAAKRRVSIEVPPQHGSHSRNGSVSSGDAIIMSRFMASHPSSELSSPTSAPQQPAVTMASIIQAAEDLTESDDSKGHSELQSPTKSTHSGDPLNDLVAHARRERKVQDLEITNASLEAINRSLERQLRKQTAELRRYRRLSRSGRLSLTSMASSRVPSDSTVGTAVGMEGGLELSDLSEDEGEDEEEEDDDLGSLYDTDPSDSESISSPGLKAADRRRKRDERRLQLDLTKHRELLVDSQKINQSIKRCLNWTEELIKDGKKALEYKVRVSDVELAPRVLAPQYEDDPDVLKSGDVGDDDGDITLPDSILDDVPPLKGANLAPPWSGDPQIRDSGIELPTDEG
ncbi:conserved hypothetical protein [Verticillium alfalfae VaMs.102]|uniref:Uncharacterized protein n=1 Tax=Verticillium alfalfae (strain VaMs.102 / ATCC MYA-4576 / FGSC 10136) TaxID=526221 RepID=C9SQR6_VERA1|nr:conserved hypothetical protein [Verticillium alfalfae VaMs.102]EEY21191.1 conserved hypothetical protein [Verticillium alfalfae VaMs.102]